MRSSLKRENVFDGEKQPTQQIENENFTFINANSSIHKIVRIDEVNSAEHSDNTTSLNTSVYSSEIERLNELEKKAIDVAK